MTVQPSPALLKIWISSNLKHLREAAGYSRADVQKRTGLSRAQIGHFETTERLPSQPVLEVLLTYYGVPERLDEFARVLDAARKGKKWWEHLASAVPPWFDLFLGLESGAAEIATFETYLIPGLLQTRDYAEAVVRGDDSGQSPPVEAALAEGAHEGVVMTTQHVMFRKSSYSDHQASCVEVGRAEGGSRLVRDSKNLAIAPLSCSQTAWQAFLAKVKGSDFD